VTSSLRQAIIGGIYPPGQWIRQEDLARELGTSRLPVREALRRLENEGLVVIVPHASARVTSLDLAEFLELYKIREVLEPLAIAESARNMTSEHFSRVRGLYDTLAAMNIGDDPAAWMEVDKDFHLATFAAAEMPRLLDLVEGYWNRTQRYRLAYLSVIHGGRRDGLIGDEHRLILNALERCDGESARSLQELHLRQTRMTLAAQSELFDS
jgi:DNA-binding GntR family transcriptional regulator